MKRFLTRQSTPLFYNKPALLIVFTGLFILLPMCTVNNDNFNRSPGEYPGKNSENFSPGIYIDKSEYRNIAFNRPAYHSSSYDYNLTAQLVTDGIKDTVVPHWISTSTSENGILKKREREWLFDHNWMTSHFLDSSSVWIQLEMGGGNNIPEIDSITLSASLRHDGQKPGGWDFSVLGSNDGQKWESLGRIWGNDYPGDTIPGRSRRGGPGRFRMFNKSVKLTSPSANRFYRVNLSAPNVEIWTINSLDLFNGNAPVEIAPSFSFISAWMSAGNKEEWVYVDLGAVCTFDQVNLNWIRSAKTGFIQVSDNASEWKNIKSLSEGLNDEYKLNDQVKGRYVRILMEEPSSNEGYILSELEVFGRGGPVAKPIELKGSLEKNQLSLSGSSWRVQRQSLVSAKGEDLSTTGFQDNNWIVATVPATVLVSYLNVGAIPDPNFGDNQLMISESFFNSDFWYRNEILIPSSYKGENIFLNFDGINWKVEVFFNGHFVGKIEGAFKHGLFNVTNLVIPGKKNALAVLIKKNDNPGIVKEQTLLSPDVNGGILGADNPTFHASIGWDWIPTIRGRNTGIWNDVYFSKNGAVTIEDPFVTTDLPLPDTTKADVGIELSLKNHDSVPVNGILHGKFGEISFEQPVKLKASEIKKVKLDPSTHPVLQVENPKLWWPNGYGKPNLYNVELTFEIGGKGISDSKSFNTGVREMAFSEEGGALRIWINGRRFIGRGGNWGFPESMLRYRAREYDAAVRYHKDMNFTIIRNWVGQTGDDEFYEACDRYGIMIWQDFWLANPVDGPNPDDNDLFMNNVEDMVLRIRNHPSLALYCGRNEGNPPEILDSAIREILPEIHPGMHYISHSSIGVVSGFGPYGIMPLKFYFENRATPKFHSELGMPNIMSYESFQKTIPDSAQWPIGRMWGLHDFCLEGNVRASNFVGMFDKHFGETNNVKDWISLAQFMNYDGYRAMFEAQSRNRMGLVIWMSHPAWPSLVWQTYDYFFEPTAAYFGCKKASEPLHIQWNPSTDSIEVVNYSSGNLSDLNAQAEILNSDGTVQWTKMTSVESTEDSMIPCIEMKYPDQLTDIHFIRLKLEKDGKIISENFYWRGLEEGNFKAIRDIPDVNLESSTSIVHKGKKWLLTTRLNNTSEHPALMVRLKIVREKSHDRILPVIYSDNYVSLMPGEQRTIRMELDHADTRDEKPAVMISGFNVKEVL